MLGAASPALRGLLQTTSKPARPLSSTGSPIRTRVVSGWVGIRHLYKSQVDVKGHHSRGSTQCELESQHTRIFCTVAEQQCAGCAQQLMHCTVDSTRPPQKIGRLGRLGVQTFPQQAWYLSLGFFFATLHSTPLNSNAALLY